MVRTVLLACVLLTLCGCPKAVDSAEDAGANTAHSASPVVHEEGKAAPTEQVRVHYQVDAGAP